MMDKWKLSCLKMTRHCIGVEKMIMNILLILGWDGYHREYLGCRTPEDTLVVQVVICYLELGNSILVC